MRLDDVFGNRQPEAGATQLPAPALVHTIESLEDTALLFLRNPNALVSHGHHNGATFAFGRYNKYPATIFLGDTGSTFLGFVLACVSVLACHKSKRNWLLKPRLWLKL